MTLPRAICLAVLLTAPAGAQLNERTFGRIRDHVLPTAEEESWRAIGWKPSLWEAVIEANAEEKPILLWTMNGHPLGQT